MCVFLSMKIDTKEAYALLEELSGYNLRTYRHIYNIPPAQTLEHHKRNLELFHHLARGFKNFVFVLRV